MLNTKRKTSDNQHFMQQNTTTYFFRFFSFSAFYLLLLAFYGYSFGDSDHIELMSYTKWLNDKTLYPSDFYIQHISQRIPNERFALAYVLSLFGNQLEICTFLLHALSSIALIWGLFLLAQRFIKSENLIWLFLFLFFFLFYKFNLGGNDIYYNALNIAKSCSIWVIYFALQRRFLAAAILAAATTLLHPMVGFQIFTLTFGAYFVLFFIKILEKKITSEENKFIKMYLTSAIIYLLTAGIWLANLFLNFNGGDLSPSLFAEIINFRLPHHFIPTAFGLKNYLILVPFFLFGAYYFYKKSLFLASFFFISISGLIIYTLSIVAFNQYAIVATQWFKTTVWLKPLALIGLLAWIESKAYFGVFSRFEKLNFNPQLGIIGLFVAFFALSIFKQKDLHFPFGEYTTAEIDIALLAKANTKKDALFLTPASCTAFKFHSERSSYIDFKAVIHSKDVFGEWYNRILEVYKLNNLSIKGLALTSVADKHFSSLTENDFLTFKEKGVTHLLCEQKQQLSFPKVAENQAFIIYEIR